MKRKQVRDPAKLRVYRERHRAKLRRSGTPTRSRPFIAAGPPVVQADATWHAPVAAPYHPIFTGETRIGRIQREAELEVEYTTNVRPGTARWPHVVACVFLRRCRAAGIAVEVQPGLDADRRSA